MTFDPETVCLLGQLMFSFYLWLVNGLLFKPIIFNESVKMIQVVCEPVQRIHWKQPVKKPWPHQYWPLTLNQFVCWFICDFVVFNEQSTVIDSQLHLNQTTSNYWFKNSNPKHLTSDPQKSVEQHNIEQLAILLNWSGKCFLCNVQCIIH